MNEGLGLNKYDGYRSVDSGVNAPERRGLILLSAPLGNKDILWNMAHTLYRGNFSGFP